MIDVPLLTDPLFVGTAAAILAVPGPTNALLAASGASRGIRASLRLISAVLTAYLGAILAWGLLLIPATAFWPPLAPLARVACALFLAATAVRLWRGTASLTATTPGGGITTRTMTLATLLNPKALLFATAVFPPAAFTQSDVFSSTALAFAAPLIPISLAWIVFGASLGFQDRISPQTAHRTAAVLLAFFSATIGVSAVI